MDKNTILNYFRNQAISGDWASLYNPENPLSYPFIQRFVKTVKLMQPIQGEVLDMGCGTGIMVKVVLDSGAQYTGFDLSAEMIEACNKRFALEVASGKAQFVLCDSSEFKSEKLFNQAIGMGYIEYFENPDEGIRQAASLIKKNGKLILSFPHKNSIDYWAVNLLSPFRKLITLLTKKYTPKPDRKMWSYQEAEMLFRKNGFKNIQVVFYNVNLFHYPFTRFMPRFSNWFSAKIEHTFFSKFSILATSFIICSEKE